MPQKRLKLRERYADKLHLDYLENPSKEEMARFGCRVFADDRYLRGLLDKKGNEFWWDAYALAHWDFARELGLDARSHLYKHKDEVKCPKPDTTILCAAPYRTKFRKELKAAGYEWKKGTGWVGIRGIVTQSLAIKIESLPKARR